MSPSRDRGPRRRASGGFSLLETLIAAFILVILGTAIVTTGLKSRTQIDYEEVRRRAILIAQERLETVRASFDYDDVVTAKIDTAIVLEGTTFTLRSAVKDTIPAIGGVAETDDAKAVTDTVRWVATGGGKSVTRRVVMSTIVFRGL
jgi:type II secretory pathway pseudopilin PulG